MPLLWFMFGVLMHLSYFEYFCFNLDIIYVYILACVDWIHMLQKWYLLWILLYFIYINMDRKRYISHHIFEFKFLKSGYVYRLIFDWFVSKDLELNLFTLAHFPFNNVAISWNLIFFSPWYYLGRYINIYGLHLVVNLHICLKGSILFPRFVLILSIHFEDFN